MAEQRDGKVTALLHGLAVLDLFGRDRTVIGVVDIAKNLSAFPSPGRPDRGHWYRASGWPTH